jgi:homoserine kinase type II
MRPHPLDRAATEVLGRYPPHLNGPIAPFGNAGGFSGAAVWRVESLAGPLCLRAGPVGGLADVIVRPHRLMGLARTPIHNLTFVPAIYPNLDGQTTVAHSGRSWELIEWMPGRADFHDRPTAERLGEACAALARLHRAWAGEHASRGRCPAVVRRWRTADTMRRHLASGWRPDFTAAEADPVRPWSERAWRVAPRLQEGVAATLAPWLDRLVPVQACLGDVWHDHLLFTGDRLTGLIDYGAVKADHRAADAGRMLGSLIGDDEARFAEGVRAYAAVMPFDDEDAALARLLDRTGVVLGALIWLRRLYETGETFEDRSAVARRLAGLVGRMERWNSTR